MFGGWVKTNQNHTNPSVNTTRAHPITTGGAALCVAAAAEAPLRRALLEGHGAPGVPGGCPAGTWAQHPTGFKELVQGEKLALLCQQRSGYSGYNGASINQTAES